MAKRTKRKLGMLFLPALQGEMGDWQYYTALMRFGDLAARVKFGGTVHKSTKLADMIQRFLKGKRAKQIAKYLKEQNQRFFSSLVIGVYGGDPEWHSMQLKNAPMATISVGDVPVEVASSFGVLGLSGKEELFALDGQHRLAGI
jgi:DNA sulfur modification protein DndB